MDNVLAQQKQRLAGKYVAARSRMARKPEQQRVNKWTNGRE